MVRGKKYVTTRKTLQKGGDQTMLSALASSRWTVETVSGYYIDRSRGNFALVLDYLRTSRRETGKKVEGELAYFGIDMDAPLRGWNGGRQKTMWTRDARCTATFSGHTSCVWTVVELSDGQIATGSVDKTVKIWTVDSVHTFTFSGHTASVYSVIGLRNGQIATGSADKTVKIWTLDGTCTATFHGHTAYVNSVTELSDGRIATGSADGTVKIWKLDGTCDATFSGHTSIVKSVIQLNDGQIATGSADKTVKIWTLDGTCTVTFYGHRDAVRSLRAKQRSNSLWQCRQHKLSSGQMASGSSDKTVKIWTLDGTCTATFSGHTDAVSSVIELSDGKIASSSWDKTAKIWTP